MNDDVIKYYPRDQRTAVTKDDIEQLVGMRIMPEPMLKNQTDEYLLKAGKAMIAVFPENLQHEAEGAITRKISNLQDAWTGNFDKIKAELFDLKHKILKTGYLVQHNEGTETRGQNKQLQAEMWFYYDEIVRIAQQHSDQAQAEWQDLVNAMDVWMGWMNGTYELLYLYFHQHKRELEKRQPGYKEPEVLELTPEDLLPRDTFSYMPHRYEPEMDEDGIYDTQHDLETWVDSLNDEIAELEKKNHALQALLGRAERVLSGEIESTQESLSELREDMRDKVYEQAKNTTWELEDKENIRLLTQVAKPEGHNFPLYFGGNTHFIRNLALRYGINLAKGNRDRIMVKCNRLAWANNYWLTIKGWEDFGEVLVSLRINKQNKGKGGVVKLDTDDALKHFKFEAKTTLVAKQHGDDFLELEREFAPLSADFKKYSIEDLIDAHKRIMAELKKRASA